MGEGTGGEELMADMGGMMLWMALGTLVLLVLLAGAIYVGVRAGLGNRSRDDAKALLDRRFAAGEIDADEYHERVSALRSLERPRR
jgi:uncharacterized membrane protein